MTTVFDESKKILAVLGQGKIPEGIPARRSSFVVTEEIPDGILAYHALLKKLVLLTGEEAAPLLDPAKESGLSGMFTEEFWLVPEDFDEIRTVEEVRSVLKLYRKPETLHSFTVLPTTDCNARCFYCFEAGCKKEFMDEATAEKAARFMLREAKEKEIRIVWFGGEPLYHLPAIRTVSRVLTEDSASFRSDMVSNAYLFDEALVREAKEDWRLKKVQITLDGTEAVYNRRKAYIYSDVNAYCRVLRNVELLSEAGIKVDLRLNVDAGNASDLTALAAELGKRFAGRENIAAYARLLYQVMDLPKAYDALFQVKNALKAAGLFRENRLSKNLHLNRCMADSGSSAVILPDGTLTSCEHFNETEPAGSLDDPAAFRETSEDRKKTYPATEVCRDCAYLPDCIRLTVCPVTHEHCEINFKRERNDEIRASMRAEYEHFLKNNEA